MKAIDTNNFMKALRKEPTERLPVWLMRQAGRYLPEYQEVRKEAGSFLNLCRNPELATKVTLQPITRFGFDAAIIFSDILIIPDAFGLQLDFVEGVGPFLHQPLRDAKEIRNLPDFDNTKILYLEDAITETRASLQDDVPLIGFAGAPFTLACYMVEGRGDNEFMQMRKLLHEDYELFQSIIKKNTFAVANSLTLQANAGADALMIFDSWASLVPQELQDDLIVKPLEKIITGLRLEGIKQPIISFVRNASDVLDKVVANCDVDCLGIDWRTDLAEVSRKFGDKVALQGNLDPAVLLTSQESIRAEVKKVKDSYNGTAGHIFNLGHGINKETPIENVEALVATVRESI